MKKINQNGFVLAETLVVAVFLMAIFTLIFSNFYPLIGEYEKRETYDDVDGKYAVYWIRKMIEDSSYKLTTEEKRFFGDKGYVRFGCSDIEDPEKREKCANLVKNLEVKGCSSTGDNCEIYITKYKLAQESGDISGKDRIDADDISDNDKKFFKYQVKKSNITRKEVNYSNAAKYIEECKRGMKVSNATEICTEEANRREFRSGFKEYIDSLPDYKKESLDGSEYRVIACFHHKNNNNYYSYATMEVSR